MPAHSGLCPMNGGHRQNSNAGDDFAREGIRPRQHPIRIISSAAAAAGECAKGRCNHITAHELTYTTGAAIRGGPRASRLAEATGPTATTITRASCRQMMIVEYAINSRVLSWTPATMSLINRSQYPRGLVNDQTSADSQLVGVPTNWESLHTSS